MKGEFLWPHLAVYLLAFGLFWTLSLLSVSTSVSALLVERFIALVCPLFYAQRLKLGFSILSAASALRLSWAQL